MYFDMELDIALPHRSYFKLGRLIEAYTEYDRAFKPALQASRDDGGIWLALGRFRLTLSRPAY